MTASMIGYAIPRGPEKCTECGEPIVQGAAGRPKTLCSRKCTNRKHRRGIAKLKNKRYDPQQSTAEMRCGKLPQGHNPRHDS